MTKVKVELTKITKSKKGTTWIMVKVLDSSTVELEEGQTFECERLVLPTDKDYPKTYGEAINRGIA